MSGKIPQSFLDDLLERTDIVELIDARVKLKKTGRNYSACCPFHDEKTPSFSVNPERQFYYCFGCGAGGNALSFLLDYERRDFVETVEGLAHHHGLEVPRDERPVDVQKQKTRRSIYDLLEQSSHYYQQQLRQHPEKNQPIDYLKQRGLSGEVCAQFNIGFSPPGWDNLLKQLAQTPEQRAMLIESGMLIEKDDRSGCYDRFRERLMFPIRDNRGRTIGFGGRVLNDDKPKYLNSPETPVFHKQLELYGLYEARQANRHLQRLIVVEGYMDVVALAQFGISYAVATLGTSAGSSHMEKVFRHCSEVIFCFDGDDAGRKAASRALQAVIPLMEAGRQAKFLFLPDGEDPDTMVRSIGQEQFEWKIEQAQSLSEYLFAIHSENLDLSRADDRAKLISNIIPDIKALPSGTFQELMLRSLSEKTGLPIDDLKILEAVNSGDSQGASQNIAGRSQKGYSQKGHDEKSHGGKIHNNNEPPKQRQKLAKSDRLVKRTPARTAIALLLLNPQFALDASDVEKLIASDEDSELLLELLQFIQRHPQATTASILGHWLSHKQSHITRLLSIEQNQENSEQLQREFLEAVAQLLKGGHREKNLSFIENLKGSPDKRFADMDADEKVAYLAIFETKK